MREENKEKELIFAEKKGNIHVTEENKGGRTEWLS